MEGCKCKCRKLATRWVNVLYRIDILAVCLALFGGQTPLFSREVCESFPVRLDGRGRARDTHAQAATGHATEVKLCQYPRKVPCVLLSISIRKERFPSGRVAHLLGD